MDSILRASKVTLSLNCSLNCLLPFEGLTRLSPMKLLLLLFALLGTCLTMTALNRTSRILNSNRVSNINQAPWMASIQLNGNHICGGTIIDKRWLLTSAACISGALIALTKVRYNTLTQNLDVGSQNVDVASMYINPNFISGNLEHNIALISTKADMDVLAFAKIPCMDSIQEGAYINAYGWGYSTEASTSLSAELQKGTLRYLELQCAPYHASVGITVDETMFCAGEHTAGGVGICKGDEGGPAIRPGFGTVHGIASFHMGCGKPFFGSVFLRVSRYTSWIEATTGTVKCIVDA